MSRLLYLLILAACLCAAKPIGVDPCGGPNPPRACNSNPLPPLPMGGGNWWNGGQHYWDGQHNNGQQPNWCEWPCEAPRGGHGGHGGHGGGCDDLPTPEPGSFVLVALGAGVMLLRWGLQC